MFLVRRKKLIQEIYPGNDAIMQTVCDDAKEQLEYKRKDCDEEIKEELPFCQLFNLGPHMCLLIDHVEMCPDETAFIRVVDEKRYTPLYKRKVRRDKKGNRFIVFNNTNHYLNDKKTQPVIRK